MQKIRQTEMLSALDRVLARDIISQIDVPEHDNSAMDGYAFHSINLHHEADAAKLVVNRRLAGEDLKFGMLQRLGCDNHRHGRGRRRAAGASIGLPQRCRKCRM